jgi:hypothetical protein
MIDRCRRRQWIRTNDSESRNKLFVVGEDVLSGAVVFPQLLCWVDSCQLLGVQAVVVPLVICLY